MQMHWILYYLIFQLPSVAPVDNVSAVPSTTAKPEAQILALTSRNVSSPVPPTINVPQEQFPHEHVFSSMMSLPM
ncbi:hypothetical protein GQ457_06G013220 [Hibiscus cannabinus]